MTSNEAGYKIPRGFSNREMTGLQRTCTLVDEWSVKFGAVVEVHRDEVREEAEMRHPSVRPHPYGGYNGGYTIERRYRVVRGDYATIKNADNDADKIIRFVSMPSRANADILLGRGYSEAAINEIGVMSDAEVAALHKANLEAIDAEWSNSGGYEG